MKTKISLSIALLLLFGMFLTPAWGDDDNVPRPDLAVLKNIPYVPEGEYRQQLDLYLPKDYEKAAKPYPLVVVVHGGGWTKGSKDEYVGIANWLVPKGYIVAINNYRLLDKAFFPAQLQDCKAAVRWLKAHADEYKIDKDRVGLWGASAGGQLVALMGSTGDTKEFDIGENLDQTSEVQVVCDMFGVTSFEKLMEERTKGSPIVMEMYAQKLVGPKVKESAKILAAYSALNHIKKGTAPTIIVHGDEDPLVPYDQSVIYEKALKDGGIDCEFITVPGGKHDKSTAYTPEVLEKIEAFYAKYLK